MGYQTKMVQVVLYYPLESTNIRVDPRDRVNWQTVQDCLADNPDYTGSLTLEPPLTADLAHQYVHHAPYCAPENDARCQLLMRFLQLANYFNDQPVLNELSTMIAYYFQVTGKELDKDAWQLFLQDYPVELSAFIATKFPYTNLDWFYLHQEKYTYFIKYLNLFECQKYLSLAAIKALPHSNWCQSIYENPNWMDDALLHLPTFTCLNEWETRQFIVSLLYKNETAPGLSWQIITVSRKTVPEVYLYFTKDDWHKLLLSPVADPVWIIENFDYLIQQMNIEEEYIFITVSRNKQVTMAMLDKYKDFKWNWSFVAEHAQLTEDYINSYSYLLTKSIWVELFANSNIRPQFLLNIGQERGWTITNIDIYSIYTNPHWTWSLFKTAIGEDRYHHYYQITKYSWMTIEDLEQFIAIFYDKYRDNYETNLWTLISHNPNLNLSFIQKHWSKMRQHVCYISLLQHPNYDAIWDDFIRQEYPKDVLYWRLIGQQPKFGLNHILVHWVEIEKLWQNRSDQITVCGNPFTSIEEFLQF